MAIDQEDLEHRAEACRLISADLKRTQKRGTRWRWITTGGMIAIQSMKEGKCTTRYPDPLSDNRVESFCGQINFKRKFYGMSLDEAIQSVHEFCAEFCANLHCPTPEPTPKAFSAADQLRARGLGIRLD